MTRKGLGVVVVGADLQVGPYVGSRELSGSGQFVAVVALTYLLNHSIVRLNAKSAAVLL